MQASCSRRFGAGRWLLTTLSALAGALAGVPAQAQSSLWNSYQGSGQAVIDFAPSEGGNLHSVEAALSQGTLSSNISRVDAHTWTVDTGSEGMLITADYLQNNFDINASQFGKPSTSTLEYTSSDLTYYGFYQQLNVGLYSSDKAGNGTLAAVASQMPVFIATSAVDKTGHVTTFCSPTCTNGSDSLQQMGIGFGRGSVAAGDPPRPDMNPLLNLSWVNGANVQTMAPGYVVTPSSILVGLTAAQQVDTTFEKLLPIAVTQQTGGSAYQIAATENDWQTPAMTLVIKDAQSGNGTYNGTLLVDTGIGFSELGTPSATTLAYNAQKPALSTSLQVYLPGMASGSGQPLSYVLLYQGACTSNAPLYTCPPYQAGQGYSPIYPSNAGNTPDGSTTGFNVYGTGAGASAFINTGENFLNYFNIVFDPVSGFIGYQVNDAEAPTGADPIATPAIALQGAVEIPGGTTVTLPTFLFEELGTAGTQANVQLSTNGQVTLAGVISSALYCSASVCSATGLELAVGTFVLTANNTYLGPTVIDPAATLALTGSGAIANSAGVSANGTFDISGTAAGASIATLSGSGAVNLGAQALTLTNAAGTFAGVIADGGLSGGAGGSLAIAAGVEMLTGNNTYTGATTIAAGAMLALAGAGSIVQSSGVAANGVFDISATSAGAAIASLSGTGTVQLGAQMLMLTNASGTFAGTIADGGLAGGTGGSLLVAGGKQTLTGVNTYSGGTAVTSGATLAINADAALGAASAPLIFNDGTLLALGAIQSSRPVLVEAGGATIASNGFVVSLGGPLTLDGPLIEDAPHTATALIEDNAILVAPQLTIAPGGTLRGVGIVAAPTTVAGTLAPGNSPGTLTFAAPVTMLPGSVTQFDIDGAGTGTGAGNYGRVLVTGAGNGFTAAGTLLPLLRGITGSASNTYTPPLGQSFLVVSAQGGVQGSYAGLTQPAGLAPGTRFDALYAPITLALVVTPQSYAALGLAGLPETSNQSAVGSVLDAGRPVAGVAMSAAQAALYAPLYPLPGSVIPAALEALTPAIDADSLMIWRTDWYLVAGAVAAAQEIRRGGQPTANEQTTEGPKGSTIWLTALGQFDTVGSGGGAPGFSGSTGGVAAGADMPVLPWLTAGAALAFTAPQASTQTSQTMSGQALHLTVYASAHQGVYFLDAQAGALFFQDGTTRPLPSYGLQARGQTGGTAAGGSVKAGAHLPLADWQIEPSLGLAGIGISRNDFTETQGGAADLAVGAGALTSIQSVLAARAERRLPLGETMAVVPTARIGWSHEFADTQGQASASFAGFGGAPFTAHGAPIGRDAALIGLGATLQTASPVSLYLAYNGAFAQNANAQTLTGGLSVKW
jgi:uncharacterized protein with beta-barrel porin domain